MGVWGGEPWLQFLQSWDLGFNVKLSIACGCESVDTMPCAICSGQLHTEDVSGQDQRAEGEPEGPERTFWGGQPAIPTVFNPH